MILSSCGKTHVGMKRSHNEDCLRVFRDENLYVVADGMGGHASGEVASEMSADTIAAFFRATSIDEEITWPYKYDYAQTYQENRIRVGVEMSNQRIFQSAVYDMKLKGMGTTMVAISFYDNKFSVGHVGDSRVYLIREGELEQITEDHSLLNDYIKLRPEGMTQEEIDAFPHKNVIVRALGMKDQVEVDVITREVGEGDILLLCSDGLSGMLTDHEMLTLINRASRDAGGILNVDLEAVCDRLIEEANRNGGNDNITVLLVRCEPTNDNATAELSSIVSEVEQLDQVTSTQNAQGEPQDQERQSSSSHELNIKTKNPFEPAWSSPKDTAHTTPDPESSTAPQDDAEIGETSAEQSSDAASDEPDSEVLDPPAPVVDTGSAAEASAAEASATDTIAEYVDDDIAPSDLSEEDPTEAIIEPSTEETPDLGEASSVSADEAEAVASHESTTTDAQSEEASPKPTIPRQSTAEFHAPPQEILLNPSEGQSQLISPTPTTTDEQDPIVGVKDDAEGDFPSDDLDDLAGPKTIVALHPPEVSSDHLAQYDVTEIMSDTTSEPYDLLTESEGGMSTVRMLPPNMEELEQKPLSTTQEMTSIDPESLPEPTMKANPTPLKNIAEIEADRTVEWSADEE